MVQKWIGHDSVPFARGEDEEDDDGEGDGDLIEHEPERVQIRSRAQLGNEDLQKVEPCGPMVSQLVELCTKLQCAGTQARTEEGRTSVRAVVTFTQNVSA